MIEYRLIPDFPGYQVGDDGSIWTQWKRTAFGYGRGGGCVISDTWKPLGTALDRYGYQCVSLRHESGKIVRGTLHRFILVAFRGPRPPGHEACHNNGIRTDNRLENLRWDTKRANDLDKKNHGTIPRGSGHKRSKLTEEEARFIYNARGVKTAKELSEQFGVVPTTIWYIWKKKGWLHIHDPRTAVT